MRYRCNRFRATASVFALAASTVWAVPAMAQGNNSPSTSVEEVTVTGTSIRGVAPVGSDLTTVTQADIRDIGATSVQGILAASPQLMGMGMADTGTTGQGAQQAIIHQLGNSASTSTLTLVDGHRVPGSGTNHSFVDPNMLPINMIQRVDILATGASSIYGSDAIAGVVNFITRSRYDGIELTGNTGFADGKQDVSAGFLAGKTWDTGSALFAYSFTRQGALPTIARPYTYPDHSNVGGKNRTSFNCDPATLMPAGQKLIYTSATSGMAVANNSNNAMCTDWKYNDLIPKTVRNNAMVKIEQDFGSRWTLSSDLLYATRVVSASKSRGTLTATAFGAGPQANPFYITPTGYTGPVTSQTIRWDSNELLGPGAYSLATGDTVYGDVNLEYKLGGDWSVDLLAMLGRDDSGYGFSNSMNASVATLALNGTTNGGGNPNQVVANTNIIYNQFPLTAANALDVWNPAATNRTSPEVIKDLTNDAMNSHLVNGVRQLRLQTQGTALQMPAGPMKVAFGVEENRISIFEYLSQAQNAGPTSNAAVYRTWGFSRSVQSVYGEANIPVISAAQGIPFVQSFALDLSGRFDHYSDFGNTANPKIAFDWQVNDDLKLRANWSTSFVAPPADEIGGDGTWNNTTYGPTTHNDSVAVGLYPDVVNMGIPGCTAASVTCNISSLDGLRGINSDPNQGPSKGHGWAVGFDYAPSYLRGFKASLTYWVSGFKGGSSGPSFTVISNSKSMAHFVKFYPNCATPAQIKGLFGNLPLVGAVPPCVQFTELSQNSNWLNLVAHGIDASLNYIIPTERWGTFSIGDAASIMTSFMTSQGDGAYYSLLNRGIAHGGIGLQMRGNVGWDYEEFGAQLFINYTGSYRNWGSPDKPVIINPITKNPASGGDPVSANTTIDLNLTYRFDDGIVGNDVLSLGMRNLFDQKPPYYSSTYGYNSDISSVVGRMITVGIVSHL